MRPKPVEPKTQPDAALASALQQVAKLLPDDKGAQLLQDYAPPARPRPDLPEAEYQKAEAAKRAASKHLEACIAQRVSLERQMAAAESKIDEAMRKEREASLAVEAAARNLAARVLPPPEASNVLHLDTILGSNSAEINLVLGDDLDLDGPAFTESEKREFLEFKATQVENVKKLLRSAFSGVKAEFEAHKKEYADRLGMLRKKRRAESTSDDGATPPAAGAASAPAQPAAGSGASGAPRPPTPPPSQPADEFEKERLAAHFRKQAEARLAAARERPAAEEAARVEGSG